jgi:hypothetical protein
VDYVNVNVLVVTLYFKKLQLRESGKDSVLFLINVAWIYNYLKEKSLNSRASVAHACNPSYLQGRNQEDHGLSLAWQIVQETLCGKYPNRKKGWWSGASGRAPA